MPRKARLLFIFGTRPEAIKLCPLVDEFRSRGGRYEAEVCVTAQHREMLDPVLELFGLSPGYDLDLMSKGQGLPDLTARIVKGTAEVIDKVHPDFVFVQGDTTTTFAASLAAYYRGVRVAHVEAGLRTGDKRAPFPEEVNRRLTSVLADVHFAPTELAASNLIAEGVAASDVFVTGNTVIDALLGVAEKVKGKGPSEFRELGGLDFGRKLVLVTCHRRESFGPSLENICMALKDIARNNPALDLVFPVHLNPNVRGPVYSILGGAGNIRLLEPLGYDAFVFLMLRCSFILSDSGGIQEEAPVLGKPVLVMRDDTERREAVESGSVMLVGSDRARIVRAAQALISDPVRYRAMAEAVNPYGGGACGRIADALTGWLETRAAV